MILFKKTLEIFIISTLTTILCAAAGGYLSFKWSFVCDIFFYFILTYFILRKFSSSLLIYFLIGLPPFLTSGLVHLLEFKNSLDSLPNFFAQYIGIAAGVFFYKSESKMTKFALVFFCFMVSVWVYFWGYDYYINNLYYGTYNNKVFEKSPSFNFSEETGNEFMRQSDIIVFDFWTTACGNCFQQFPQLEELFQNNNKNSRIKIYAVNLPLERDSTFQAFCQLKTFNYHFPVLKSLEEDSVLRKKLGINGVPYTIILDKNNNIRYRGSLKNVQSTINDILAEINNK